MKPQLLCLDTLYVGTQRPLTATRMNEPRPSQVIPRSSTKCHLICSESHGKPETLPSMLYLIRSGVFEIQNGSRSVQYVPALLLNRKSKSNVVNSSADMAVLFESSTDPVNASFDLPESRKSRYSCGTYTLSAHKREQTSHQTMFWFVSVFHCLQTKEHTASHL